MFQKLKGYRTVLLNAIPLGLMLTDYAVGSGNLINTVVGDPKIAALTMMGLNGANIALRFVTTTKVGTKE